MLQADKGDEKPYAASDGRLDTGRNGISNQLSYFEEREDNKEYTFYENSRQCELPAIPHAEAHRKYEKRVDAHSWSQSKGLLGVEGHRQRPDGCGQHSGCEYCAGRHPFRFKSTEHARIHSQYVSHGKKGGDTSINLCTHLMMCRVKPK